MGTGVRRLIVGCAVATSAMVAVPAALVAMAAPAAAASDPAPDEAAPSAPEDEPMTIDATALLDSLLGTLGVPLRLPLPSLPLPLPAQGLSPTDPPADAPTTDPSPPAPPTDPAAPAAPAGTSTPTGTRVHVRVGQPGLTDAPPLAAAADTPRGLLREVGHNAAPFSVALVVGLVVVAFLAVQGRLDRRDPRLVAAPVSADEGMLAFDG